MPMTAQVATDEAIKMTSKRYAPTALGIYMNYLIHGMGVIMISQHQEVLMAQWGTDLMGISSVISMLGIGRLIAIVASGPLSDKFGRRPFIKLGMAIYLIFFLGILLTTNIHVAMACAVVAGLANSCLDSGSYPALMEAFPLRAGTANVLIKAFVQIGQFILPFMISLLVALDMWFGWTFILVMLALVVNMVYLSRQPFPDEDMKALAQAQKAQQADSDLANPDADDEVAIKVINPIKHKAQPKMWLEGTAFILYGFVSQATFYVVSQYINTYGQATAGLSTSQANQLLSYYSIGSVLCVAVSAWLASRVRTVNLVLVYTFASAIAIFLMWQWPTPTILRIGSFLVGFFAAGGVMQLGLTVMGQMLPVGKGAITSVFYTFGSIASFTMPMIAGYLAQHHVAWIMALNFWIAVLGFVLALIIFIRYYQIIDTDRAN
ncbi:MFS transporter [Aerococcus urinaehominis]|nr:MFS transporter [Aerococcus urinaehominis]